MFLTNNNKGYDKIKILSKNCFLPNDKVFTISIYLRKKRSILTDIINILLVITIIKKFENKINLILFPWNQVFKCKWNMSTNLCDTFTYRFMTKQCVCTYHNNSIYLVYLNKCYIIYTAIAETHDQKSITTIICII